MQRLQGDDGAEPIVWLSFLLMMLEGCILGDGTCDSKDSRKRNSMDLAIPACFERCVSRVFDHELQLWCLSY